MSFLALCERLDVTVATGEDLSPEAFCFFGSDEAAAEASDSNVALLPSGLTRFEAGQPVQERGFVLLPRSEVDAGSGVARCSARQAPFLP